MRMVIGKNDGSESELFNLQLDSVEELYDLTNNYVHGYNRQALISVLEIFECTVKTIMDVVGENVNRPEHLELLKQMFERLVLRLDTAIEGIIKNVEEPTWVDKLNEEEEEED